MANMFPSPLEIDRFISRDKLRKIANDNVSVPSRGG